MGRRRLFSPAFKRNAVRQCKKGDRSIGQIARELGIAETALRSWIKSLEVGQREVAPTQLSDAERNELVRLRHENRRLRSELNERR
jgi:transposase